MPAAKDMDISKLDNNKLKKIELFLLTNKSILKSLDMWISLPDKDLKKDLIKLIPFINKLYNFKSKPVLYRGFTIKIKYQETFDFNSKDNIGTIKDFKVKEDMAISFSSDSKIAEGFGNYLVKIENYDLNKTLILTDELCYYISLYRNLKHFQTQEEFIIFGEQDIKVELVKVTNFNFFKW